jgi:hypothetical protein
MLFMGGSLLVVIDVGHGLAMGNGRQLMGARDASDRMPNPGLAAAIRNTATPLVSHGRNLTTGDGVQTTHWK